MNDREVDLARSLDKAFMDAEFERLVERARRFDRQRELNAKALVESALVVRDLKAAIRQALAAIERKSFETARLMLKQALDEMPWPQRRRER